MLKRGDVYWTVLDKWRPWPPHHRVRSTLLAAALSVSAVAGCSSSGSSPAQRAGDPAKSAPSTSSLPVSLQVKPAGTFSVGHATRTFVDTSRGTDAHGDAPAATSRSLETLILFPVLETPQTNSTVPDAGEATPLPGPWPVIVFGHGSTRKPADYLGKLTFWASAGYVVVAPAFPLSKEGAPGGTSYGDYPNQTGDESFLIDQLTGDDAAPLHLKSLVDTARIGVGGQSFGAITADGLVAAKCCADKRIRAATTFAGAWLPFPSKPSKNALAPWARDVSVLFFHGSDDPTLPYSNDHAFFERLGAPGGFVTLVGSGHDPGFFDGTAKPLDALVSKASLAFYDQHLKDGPNATPIIERLVKTAGPEVATFTPSR